MEFSTEFKNEIASILIGDIEGIDWLNDLYNDNDTVEFTTELVKKLENSLLDFTI